MSFTDIFKTGSPEAKLAIKQSEFLQNVDRRKEMQKRIDYYNGVQEKYLRNELTKQFEYPDRLKLQEEFQNITKMIIDELAVLYSEEPHRAIEINGEKSEKDQEIYDEIVESGMLNIVMDTANKMTKLTKTILIRPVIRDVKNPEIMTFDIITPNSFDVVKNLTDNTQADGILVGMQGQDVQKRDVLDVKWGSRTNEVINSKEDSVGIDPFDADNTVFVFWTDESHFRFNAKGKVLKIENNDKNVNPYGELPFVVLRDKYPINNFFIEGGSDLPLINENINIKFTELNYLAKMQSFSVPVRTGAAQDSSAFTLDPSMTVDLSTGSESDKAAPDFKFVSPDAKMEDMISVINDKLEKLAVVYKLNPNSFVVSKTQTSGFSIQMQNFQLSRQVKADMPYYRAYEKQLYQKIKTIWNIHNPGRKLSEDSELNINFREIQSPVSQEEKDAHNIVLYQNGITSRSRWLMEEDQDIKSTKDAMKILDEINEERKKEDDSSQEHSSDGDIVNLKNIVEGVNGGAGRNKQTNPIASQGSGQGSSQANKGTGNIPKGIQKPN